MTLVTYRLLQDLSSSRRTDRSGSTLPIPVVQSPGVSHASIAFIFLPLATTRWEEALHTLAGNAGLTVYPFPIDASRDVWIKGARKCRSVIPVCDAGVEGSQLTNELIWRLGWASGMGLPVAILPVFRRYPRKDRYEPKGELAGYPYIGLSKGVGDDCEAFWVIPPGQQSTSRKAQNLDYWIDHRQKHRFDSG